MRFSPGITTPGHDLKFKQINYVKFAAVKNTSPQRPPLVLIHGLNSSSKTFQSLVPHLAAERDVIIYDLRGHGDTVEPGRGYDLETLALDLKSLIDGLGYKRVDLLGHSAGGFVALSFSSLFPTHVNKVILEDVSGLPIMARTPETVQRALFAIERLRKNPFSSDQIGLYREYLERLFDHPKTIESILQKSKSRDRFDSGRAAAIEELMLDTRTRDFSRTIEKRKGALFYLRAEIPTRHFSDDHLSKLRSFGYPYLVFSISGAGHSIHVDQPQQWLSRVRLILNSK